MYANQAVAPAMVWLRIVAAAPFRLLRPDLVGRLKLSRSLARSARRVKTAASTRSHLQDMERFMEGTFPVNLLRLIGSQLALQNSLSASREIFGRSYFTLGVIEKAAVDQAVILALASNFQALTPEFLDGQQEKKPIGFPLQSPPSAPANIPSAKA